jgi:phosphoglycolate phosphatase
LAQPFDALVFDLDGTLVDTAPDLHAHLNEMLAELGRPGLVLEEIRPMIGDGARALLKRGLEASGGLPVGCDHDLLFERFLARYTADPVRFGALYDGVLPLLDGLAQGGVRLGVCTNKPQAPSARILELLGLSPYFTALIGGDVLPTRKPDAGHIGAVLERLRVAPSRALMVGDSTNDLLAARAAGIPCVLVSFGYTPIPARELGADLVIDRFSDLPDALSRLAPPPA